MVDFQEAERTPANFDLGPNNLIIVDWQINVEKNVSPDRLLALIRFYVSRGFRVAVVMWGYIFSHRVVVECVEAGACSFALKEIERTDLFHWLTRVLALPMRGPWVQNVVFP